MLRTRLALLLPLVALAAAPAAAETLSTVLQVPLGARGSALEPGRYGVLEEDGALSVPPGSDGVVEARALAPFRFAAAALLVHGRFPQGSRVEVELAVSRDGKHFEAPIELGVDEDLSDLERGVQASTLLLLPRAEGLALEWRLRLVAGAEPPAVTQIDLHLIDATAGPTEMELLLLREQPRAQSRAEASSLPKPSVITRAQWGAKAATSSYSYCQPTTHMGVHHTASRGTPDADLSACATHVRSIQAYHMNSNGWSDIGYNYLVCRHGTLFEGRGGGDNVRAAHDGLNCDSMGVTAIGYHHSPYNEQPTSALLSSLAELLAWKASQRGIDPQGRSTYRAYGALMDNVYGHRNVKSTACPGDLLYAQLGWLRDEVQRRLNGNPIQKGNLVGLVLEEGSNARLQGARCDLSPGGQTAFTGPDGYYRFEDLTAGQSYTVSVTHPGYLTQSKSRTIEAGIDNWNSLWLTPSSTGTTAVR
jgi:hypothetical protein